jgi:small subunit ribosomal protein S20
LWTEEVGYLPNIKSAKKRVSVSAAENARNKADKTRLKTALKKFDAAVAESDKKVISEVYTDTVKMIDQSAAKGIIHKNAAARRKSRLMKFQNKQKAEAAQ